MIPSAIYFMDLVSPGQAVIRPYTPADRAAVRKICCDTAEGVTPTDLPVIVGWSRESPAVGFRPRRQRSGTGNVTE